MSAAPPARWRGFPGSLRARLLWAAAGVQTLVLVFSLMAAYRIFGGALNEALARQAVASRILLAQAAMPSLVERDYAELGDVLAEAVRGGEAGLVYVQVLDTRERVVASAGLLPVGLAGRPGRPEGDAVDAVLRFDSPIQPRAGGGQDYGRLRFGLSQAPLREGLRHLSRTLLVIGVLGLSLGVLVQVWLANTLTRGLARLAAGVRGLQGSQASAPLPVQGADEIARLSEAFNAMSATLTEQFAQLQASELALKRHNEQLDQRVAERTVALEQAREQAEAANRAKSAFLSHMSHELRTPLNAILGFAQVLIAELPVSDERRHSMLKQIEQAGWHLLNLINDVLDHSRVESGQLALRLEPLRLLPLCDEALRLAEPQAQALALRLRVEAEPQAQAALVLADRTRLRQVLDNLVSNAVKYNRQGGELVLLLARAADGGVSLTVCDTGQGLSAEQLGHLYEPFNRLGAERSAIGGTGIGLVITRQLVELMGGRLGVQSTPGQGTRFEVWLPGADGVEEAA